MPATIQTDPPVLRLLVRGHAGLRARLSRLLALEAEALAGGSRGHARRYRRLAAAAGDLRQRLWVHVRQEEDILFPIVDATQGADGGPMANLRAAHIHMLEMLSGCHGAARALALPSAAGDEALRARVAVAAHQFSQLLPEHLEQEESVLFGIVRRRLVAAKLRGVLARMEALARALRRGPAGD